MSAVETQPCLASAIHFMSLSVSYITKCSVMIALQVPQEIK